MADTGFKTTGTVVSNAWSPTAVTTTNINTSDDNRAANQGTTFNAATCEDFTFGIPSGATINGIEVTAEFSASIVAIVATLQLSLSWDNGSSFTATKSDTVTGTTDTSKTFGGATDTWGRSWTDSEFANGTFQVYVEGKTNHASYSCRLDYLAIKVYYTAATGAQGKVMFIM